MLCVMDEEHPLVQEVLKIFKGSKIVDPNEVQEVRESNVIDLRNYKKAQREKENERFKNDFGF